MARGLAYRIEWTRFFGLLPSACIGLHDPYGARRSSGIFKCDHHAVRVGLHDALERFKVNFS